MSERIHFVTGRLAEHSLRGVLAELAPQVGFDYSVDVLGITVAALLTTDWVAPRMHVPQGTSRIVLPGYCQGELDVVAKTAGVPVERGPRDLRRLPEYFGHRAATDDLSRPALPCDKPAIRRACRFCGGGAGAGGRKSWSIGPRAIKNPAAWATGSKSVGGG